MPGHNGGFNPYRDQNGEFTDQGGAGKTGRSRSGGSSGGTSRARTTDGSGAKSSGGSSAGRSFNGARPGEVATQAKRWTPAGVTVRPGGTPYRNRASLQTTKPAPVNPIAKLTKTDRKSAIEVVNTYAGSKGQRLDAKSDNQTVVRLLRSTINKAQPIMSYEEQEAAESIIAKLTKTK